MRTSIVQFGTSRFLQAHVDLFVHEANEADGGDRSIVVVASSGTGSRLGRLAGFNDPAGYPVLIRGLADGVPVDGQVRVRSVKRGLDSGADWPEIVRIVTQDADFIVSNTTESGFAVPADVVVDLDAAKQVAPDTYPAKLLALLALRFDAGGRALTILPTELLPRNGDTLKAIVLDLAARSHAPQDLVDWIARDCIFANSLVDRIVSGAIEPVGAIAEPYALWAVEAQPGLVMPCEHPAIRIVDDLEPYARLKLHILNLGHTVLAEHWLENALPPTLTVREILADPEIRAMLLQVYADEVQPGFAARAMAAEASAYITTTLARFDNPFLDHRMSDIANGHKDKISKRIVGFMDWIAGSDAPPTPSLRRIAQKHPTAS